MSIYRTLVNETPEQVELRELRVEYVRLIGAYVKAQGDATRYRRALDEWHTFVLLLAITTAFWAMVRLMLWVAP